MPEPTIPPSAPTQNQPSNAPAIPTDDGTETAKVKDTRTVIQRMSELRDLLQGKYPKTGTTIRIDVTSSAPGIEYLAFNQAIPEVDGQAKRHGTLRSETLKGLEDLIRSLPQ